MARRKIRRKSFDEEVRSLEKLLGQYDDELMEEGEIDEVLTQDDLMDEEVDVEDDFIFVDDDVVEEDEDFDLELESMYSSEDEPGVEDEITQDYLDEVEKEEGKDKKVPTEDSVKEAKVSKFKEASRRLDRVASYFEKSGRKDLALRIDKLSSALDKETKKLASVK